MTTCPFCGTTYTEYRSNCKSCGAPLPKPAAQPAAPVLADLENEVRLELQEALSMAQSVRATPLARPDPPPPAPRPISSMYIFRIMVAEAWGIVGLVFALIGTSFSCVGLSAFTARNPGPLIFGGIGLLMGGIGWVLLIWQLQKARKVVEALRTGDTAEGQITEVTQDYSTRINGQHPWIIRYQFSAAGTPANGEVRTMAFAGYQYRAGMPAWVLFLRGQPEYNSLYPHP